MKLHVARVSLSATIALIGACAPPTTPPPVPNTPPPNNQPRMNDRVDQTDKPKMLMEASPALSSIGSLSPDAPAQLQVELYQLQVPFGSISRNEQFWKRVDE